jgi:DNA repair ATPase RecN
MRKLDKATCAQRDEITGRVRSRASDLQEAAETFNTAIDEAWETLEAAIEAFNTTLEEKWEPIEQASNDYNEAVNDANAWKQDVAGDIQSYMDDRSEKWQEGEAAGRYTAWKEQFEEEFETADLERPEPIEVEQPGHIDLDLEDVAELLEQLPEQLDSLF